jgi:hypothetical protein
MVDPTTAIGVAGITFGFVGPAIAMISSKTDIWRRKTDSDRYDRLTYARDQMLDDGLESDKSESEAAFEEIYQLLDKDADLPPMCDIDEFKVTQPHGWSGDTRAFYYTEGDTDSPKPKDGIMFSSPFDRLVEGELQSIRREGEMWFLWCGLILLFFGYLLTLLSLLLS